ncbi:MAG: S41 family peptidase [Eubacteriales bacterium]|nr:S41 family peptidase [Eubacteriales bacterium]
MKNLPNRLRFLAVLLAAALLVTGCSLLPSAKSVTQNALDEDSDTVTLTREEYDRLARFASLDTLSQIVEEYYYVEPDLDAMLDGAKRGLLAGLGDPYTFYYSAEEFSEMWADDEGEYAGVGIQISASYETMLCTISRVFSNSPAAEAGLRKGDILSKVDDLDVDVTTLNDAVAIMRGEVGSSVYIQVMRDGELIDFNIPRAVVHVNWVSSCMLDESVGYILLYEFSGNCAEMFQTQLDALVAQGAKALIIDLRDNPGGWIENAVSMADIFLPKETITYLEYRDGSREYYDATDGALNLPLIVMMNENSASSSEILAGALQDYAVATIVGTQSYGKGIVQFVLPVGNDGEGMQLTSALYYTPSGRSIHKIGITPDVETIMPEGAVTMYELGDLNDAQLQKAYEVAQEKLAGTFPENTPAPTVEESTVAPAAQVDSPAAPQAEDLLWFRVS